MTIWNYPSNAALFHDQSRRCASFHHSFLFNRVSSSVNSHVSKDDDMKCPSRTSLFHHQSWSVHLFDIHSNATICPYRSIAMFQKMTIWRCPSSTSLFSRLLSGVTRSWTIFEQRCPQYDLNVLVHWLYFFEHHCLQFTDSSFNHLSLSRSCSEYCLFFPSQGPLYCSRLLNFSRSVEER